MSKAKPRRNETPVETLKEPKVEARQDDGFFAGTDFLSRMSAKLMAENASAHAVLNSLELKAIRAIVDYTAYTQKASAETVAAMVSAQFGVGSINALPSRCYNEIVCYLIDLKVETSLN